MINIGNIISLKETNSSESIIGILYHEDIIVPVFFSPQ